MNPKILSVGQCDTDKRTINSFLRSRVQAEVEDADSCREAVEKAKATAYDLALVNRILDATEESGINLVRDLLLVRGDLPIMLVSNFAGAQAQAVQAGAIQGFGKSSLAAPETIQRIRAALGIGADR